MAAQKQVLDAFGTEHLHVDLRSRSVRGGLLTLTSQGAQFLMQSIATVVLARLLTPADFGLVAMVTAITGLGQAFADLGLSEATIQRPEITHRSSQHSVLDQCSNRADAYIDYGRSGSRTGLVLS